MSGPKPSIFRRDQSGHHRALASDRPVFWLGVIGVLLTGLVSVWFGAASHDHLENRVEEAAQAALSSAGYDWAEVRAHGQRIALSGAAPSSEALVQAVTDTRSALGPGGVVRGGVTKVTALGVDVLPYVSPYAWGAIREGRQITLEGVAPDRETLRAIEGSARERFGAANVVSRMTLGRGAPENVNWANTAVAGLSALNRLDRGSAELSGASLVVTGSTNNELIAGEVRAALSDLTTGADVTAFISGPAEWSARLTSERLSFSGVVADEETQQLLTQIAADSFSVGLVDNSRIGDAGGWRNRVSTALRNLARFQTGQIDVLGEQIRISGRAPASAISFLRDDMNAIQDEFTVVYDVVETAPEIAEISGVDLDATDPGELQASCQEAFAQIMSSNQILFESSAATIDRQSGETLDKLIVVVRRCASLRIEIQGHTDATGRAAANRQLSEERAAAVRAYFISNGIAAEQVYAAGYGEERPIATNRTAAGRQQNRRIEFSVTSAEDAQ